MDTGCKGCERSVTARLVPAEVQRLLISYLAAHPQEGTVDDAAYEARLAACVACPDLTFAGTTCRHCGCLVAIRAKLAGKACPAPQRRWMI
jgi:hypothetical protein